MDGQSETSRDVVVDDPLALTLGSIYATAPAPPPLPPRAPSPPSPPLAPSPPSPPTQPTSRRRLNNGSVASQHSRGETPPEDVVVGEPPAALAPALFPWATEQPARHDTLRSLLLRGITSVEGEVLCKRCGYKVTVAYDLETKFREVSHFIAANQHDMNDRAPGAWLRPALSDCGKCGESSCMWPVIAADNSEINWLFLLLGQMLSCCSLGQLKYFCKNTGRHRTGSCTTRIWRCAISSSRSAVPNGNGFLYA